LKKEYEALNPVKLIKDINRIQHRNRKEELAIVYIVSTMLIIEIIIMQRDKNPVLPKGLTYIFLLL